MGSLARSTPRTVFLYRPRCTTCGCKLLTATAYVPAVVLYEGKRAAKARTQTAPEDPGFHTLRVECKECKKVGELRDPCPLCGGAPD